MLETLIFPFSIFVLVNVFFAVSLIKMDFGVVDLGWGLGISLISALSLFLKTPLDWHITLANIFILIWGLRLTFYLLLRNSNKDEDYRYKALREKWGESANFKAYFFIFIGQGCLMLLMSLTPLTLHFSKVVNHYPVTNTIGFLLFAIGFLIESLSDYSLYQFKKDKENKGEVFQSGPWKFSRHPNYFGEILLWWGIFLFGFSSPSSWITIISPLLITLLITKFSGIPLLEKRYENDPSYKEYVRKTNTLIFGPQKD